MPRSVRIEYRGAVYHIMSRGDRREEIFRTAHDYESFLETLAETCERTGFRIHAYVLMPNHYHLLLETPEPNLVAGMKWLQGTYTQRFNCRNKLNGHLFQGRYKATPMDAQNPDYFRRVSSYIHLNPARVPLLDRVTPRLLNYSWSSYPAFVRADKLPAWLVRTSVFGSVGLLDEGLLNRKRYERMMERRAAECMGLAPNECKDEWDDLRRGWYLGNDDFRTRLLDHASRLVQGRVRSSYCNDGLVLHDEQTALRQLDRACACLGIALEDLCRRKHTDPEKQAVAWWVKSRCVVRDEWLCTRLDMGCRTNIHRAVSAYRSVQDDVRKQLKGKLQLCAD